MYHGVWSKFCSRLHQRVPVADICFYQADIAIRQLAYAGERDGRTVRKIVEDADFMTRRQERDKCVAADITRPAGDQHFHRNCLPSTFRWTYNSIGKIVESTAWLSLRFSRR